MTPDPLGSGPLAKADKEERKGAGLPSFGFQSPSATAAGSSFLQRGGSVSLLERLRNLKTSEMAFIVAGAGALVLAPLAEHMISRSDEEGTLEAGFDSRGNPFQDDLPYEDGVAGMAAGGLLGDSGGRRVVTPLQAPDPLHMIVGSEGSAPPPMPRTSGAGPARKPAPRKKTSNWKDALSNAAKSGVSKAAGSARLPKPNAKLAGSLKGLAALSSSGGSTTASLPAPKLEAPSSKGLTGSQKVASALSRVTASPDFRGEASRGLAAGGAERAAGAFDGRIRTGSGNSEFLTPTSQASAGGAAAGGRGQGDGADEKGPGVSSAKNERQMGESLAFQQKKMEMQKAVDLKFAKKQYAELDKQKMLDQVRAQTQSQLMLKGVDIAGQLANTALQAALNQGQEGQGQGQGAGAGPGNPGAGPAGELGSGPSFDSFNQAYTTTNNTYAAEVSRLQASNAGLRQEALNLDFRNPASLERYADIQRQIEANNARLGQIPQELNAAVNALPAQEGVPPEFAGNLNLNGPGTQTATVNGGAQTAVGEGDAAIERIAAQREFAQEWQDWKQQEPEQGTPEWYTWMQQEPTNTNAASSP